MNWRKSTYSAANGDCCEVASWRKSAHSGANGQKCAEVGHGPGIIGVRDSKDPDGPVLEFAAKTWAAFVSSLRS